MTMSIKQNLRRALGQFPTGVTVMTARRGNELVGVTASSFNTVSLEPPLILWSIDKAAFSADIFINSDYFTVNVLNESQTDISNKFASKGADKFSDVDFENGLGNVPLLNDCIANFQCEVWNVHDGGDHYIIIGEVKKYDYSENLKPLVFSQGQYSSLVPMATLQN